MVFVGLACSSSLAQKQHTTPVPILKQINRHNEDGSYSYGYEAADGSYKIETKAATGEVKGKYGYVDDSGNLREVEYGANKDGFHPTGTGINVAPAAPHNSGSQYPALGPDEIDDGQYREDPAIYNDPKYNSKPSKAATNFRFNQKPSRPAPQPQYFEEAQPQQERAPIPTQAQRPRFQQPEYQQPAYQSPNYYYQPQQQQQQPNYYQPANNYYQPQPQPQVNIFAGHPAQNLDLNTGSYSVSYGK